MNVPTRKQPGFTIIEVVLVLAIAALIFLMVFVALPALQASQRDTARKNDAGIVSSAVTKFTAGERKSLTTSTADRTKLRTYVDNLDQYEVTGVMLQSPSATVTAMPAQDQIFVYPGAKCAGSNASSTGANVRQAAVVIALDNMQNTYCVDAS